MSGAEFRIIQTSHFLPLAVHLDDSGFSDVAAFTSDLGPHPTDAMGKAQEYQLGREQKLFVYDPHLAPGCWQVWGLPSNFS